MGNRTVLFPDHIGDMGTNTAELGTHHSLRLLPLNFTSIHGF